MKTQVNGVLGVKLLRIPTVTLNLSWSSIIIVLLDLQIILLSSDFDLLVGERKDFNNK